MLDSSRTYFEKHKTHLNSLFFLWDELGTGMPHRRPPVRPRAQDGLEAVGRAPSVAVG